MLTRVLFFLACFFSLTVSAQEKRKLSLFENRVELTIPELFLKMNEADIQKRFNRGTPPILFLRKKKEVQVFRSL